MHKFFQSLKRPIVFFDFESATAEHDNPNPSRDSIVQIGATRYNIDGTMDGFKKLVKPRFPITNSEIHGITDEMVKDAPSFGQIAPYLKEFSEGCDLGGFNSTNYDVVLFDEEMRRAGLEINLRDRLHVDVGVIFKRKEERTLTAAVKFYLGEELGDAHDAYVDAFATFKVFSAQLERYPDIGEMTLEQLSLYSTYDVKRVDLAGKVVIKNGVPIFTFGQNKNQPVLENFGLYRWMQGKDFSTDTLEAIGHIFENPNQYEEAHEPTGNGFGSPR